MPNVITLHIGPEKEYPTGCEIYRGNMPMFHLGLHKPWLTSYGYSAQVWNGIVQYGESYWQSMIDFYDIFVFPRMVNTQVFPGMAEVIQTSFDEIHAKGKKIVYEVDDDLTNEHRKVIDGTGIDIAKNCDAITVTTPHLKRLMEDRTGKPAYVLPNMIDPQVWKDPRERHSYQETDLVIGLTGSTTHMEDWRVLKDVLPGILEYPNVHLILGGFQPEYLKGLPKTEFVPAIEYVSYAQMIKMCDIILAPVIPGDPFNLSKSPIKVIEGMGAARKVNGRLAGAACIATDNPVYRLAIQNKHNGLLVEHTPEAWTAALDMLINDHQQRQKLQYRGFQWVWKHHDMSKEWRQWAKAYQQILVS